MSESDLEERVVALETRMAGTDKWAAEHDGRINAWWVAQHEFNPKLESRVSALEKRVILVTGFGAGAGAVAGTLLTAAFKLV